MIKRQLNDVCWYWSNLIKNGVVIVFPQPTFSTDITPADYKLFARMEAILKGHGFQSGEEGKVVMKAEINEVSG
jgi:hypothetical protein